MTSITIPEDAISAIVSRAILEGISAEHRDLVMQQAVKSILAAPRDTYGRPGETPLQLAFDNAARVAVQRAVHEFVDGHPEFRARIDEAISERMRELLNGSWNVRNAVSEALVAAMIEVQAR